MSISKLPDHVVESVEANLYPLKPLISRDKFLSNDELIAKLNAVEGISAPVARTNTPVVDPLFQNAQPLLRIDRYSCNVGSYSCNEYRLLSNLKTSGLPSDALSRLGKFRDVSELHDLCP
jgi:hypothetical protein